MASHPTSEHLAGYANGAISEGMSLLVAAHLTYCPACRKTVEQFELIGGSLMLEEAPVVTSQPSLEAALMAIDTPEPKHAIVDDPGTPLPMPIRAVAGRRLDEMNWKFRLPGLHEADLEGFDDEEHVSLMRIRPGTSVLHHTHEGEEATLVLSGEMEDGGKSFRCGDVALADHTDDHKPRIVGEEICYCLVVLTGKLRFTGPVGRALNLFTR